MCEMRSADRYEEKGVKTEKLKRKRKRGRKYKKNEKGEMVKKLKGYLWRERRKGLETR